MIHKFKMEVIRTDEYEIEIDDSVWTPEEIKNWGRSFQDAETPEAIARNLAMAIMRQGSAAGFMEGFGIVKTFNRKDDELYQYEEGFKRVTEYTNGLSVKVICEDDDYEVNIL